MHVDAVIDRHQPNMFRKYREEDVIGFCFPQCFCSTCQRMKVELWVVKWRRLVAEINVKKHFFYPFIHLCVGYCSLRETTRPLNCLYKECYLCTIVCWNFLFFSPWYGLHIQPPTWVTSSVCQRSDTGKRNVITRYCFKSKRNVPLWVPLYAKTITWFL
jgi:hypothetical protein